MSGRKDDTGSAFRLNLEQQKNRAKDLLRAVRSQDAAALARVASRIQPRLQPLSQFKLADAYSTGQLRLAMGREAP